MKKYLVIYQKKNKTVQSGKKTVWLAHFSDINKDQKYTEDNMGWTGTKGVNYQVKLRFDSKEDAINYAKNNNLEYKINDVKKRNFVIKSYTNQFIKRKY